MRIQRMFLLLLLAGSFFTTSAQLPDSTKAYVWDCISRMECHSLYAKSINWNTTREAVSQKLNAAVSVREAEDIVIWVFEQLKDHHGMYGGIDTSFRYPAPGPERKFSESILEEYRKPRAVKIEMLDDAIAYYKMPAVIIGSNTEKMKQWANILMDSFCAIAARNPKAFIIDLRMNNGGNSEPMWQTLRFLTGDRNRIRLADANGKLLKEERDPASLEYQRAGTPDRLCTIDERIPVAVLIGPGTASSGEIMALSFTTRRNTRLFGEPTIGVANATNGFVVRDKGYLLNAKKKLLKKMYVEPDVMVKNDGDNFSEPQKDATVRQAMAWLRKKI
jgi:carboxyl-terminal processing protease